MVEKASIIHALASLEAEIECLEHYADQARGMLATLQVNFGHNGRVASGIARAGDSGNKQLFDVLRFLVERSALASSPIVKAQAE